MHNWRKSINISYKRWGNSKIRGEANFVGESDEDQGTDNEICTVATAREGSGRRRSASRSTFDKMEETFTVDDVLENMGFGKFQWKMALLTGLAWIGDAMEMMILSILGPQLHCEWKLPSYKVAVMTSAVFVGMGIGSPAWGTLIDKYGRRVGLIICSTWTLYFSLLSAFAPVFGWLVFLRALVGFGLAGSPQSVTLYSEFLPVKSRGCYIMLIMVFWSAGTLLEVLLALLIMPTLGWRWLLGLSSVPLLIFVCSCIWLPESPRFDLLMGRTKKAMATLSRIAKDNGKNMPQGRVIASKQNERGRIKELFISQYWKTTLPLCFIWFANAFSYYGIILLTTEMFQTDSCWVTKGAKIEPHCSLECKYLTSDDYKDLLWTTLAEFPGLLIVLLVVDRLGRKKSMALCFFIFFLFVLPLYSCLERLSITIVIFIARAFISAGFQVAYVYTPEVFPTENRALAMGTCSAMARVGSLIAPFVSQLMLSVSVRFTLSLNCGIALLAGFACLMLPIETLGRDLQESSPGNEAATQMTDTTNHSTFSSDQG